MNKNKVLYFPLNLLLHLVALLPFRMLYVFSDILYFCLFYVFRYRVKIARKNINDSFPEIKEEERTVILKKFYKHFADYFVETIKLLHISDAQMRKRMIFENVELIDECINKRNSIAIYLGHYGNWEWIPSITLWCKYDADEVIFAQIYRKLRNDWFDSFFLNIRSRFHSHGIEKKNTLRELLRIKNEGKLSITGFMSDQHPSGDDVHHVIKFLNHDTAIITGTEVIAKRLGMDVLFFDIKKMKRGYYKAEVKKITLDSKNELPMAITDAYTSMLEENINRQPELWLWTHKRWKHKCKYPIQPLTPLKESK